MTTNEMIYKTINTKLTKEPVYKSVLEDLGYEVYDSTWSAYNNWTVKNKATGRAILLSKGYNNKKGLYDIASPVKCTDIKKVNYVGYLNKNKEKENRGYFEVNHSEYYKLRNIIKKSKRSIKHYNEELDCVRKKIEKLNRDIEWYNNEIACDQELLNKTRKRVVELKAR